MSDGAGKQAGSAAKQATVHRVIIAVLVAALAVSVTLLLRTCSNEKQEAPQPQIEQAQGAYVKPETPVDRSKNVTLPGWGGFTIPANQQRITQGFEFHNPAENLWYEDRFTVDGTKVDEKLVVDSGNKVELNRLLELAGADAAVAEVSDYDSQCFAIAKDDAGAYALEGTGGFDGEKTISAKTVDGQRVDIKVSCEQQCYYMTFGLYLSDGDELLFQSGLVSPGNYVQDMQMTRALEPGTYDAYVACQPYRSDGVTKTNQGVVKITLTVK